MRLQIFLLHSEYIRTCIHLNVWLLAMSFVVHSVKGVWSGISVTGATGWTLLQSSLPFSSFHFVSLALVSSGCLQLWPTLSMDWGSSNMPSWFRKFYTRKKARIYLLRLTHKCFYFLTLQRCWHLCCYPSANYYLWSVPVCDCVPGGVAVVCWRPLLLPAWRAMPCIGYCWEWTV